MSQTRAQIDKMLSDVSNGYFPAKDTLIAEQVLPQIPVKQKTGKLGKHGTAHLRIEKSLVGGLGEYRRVTTRAYSTDSYDIEGHGLEGVVTKDDYRNVEKPFDAESDETVGVSTLLLLEKEKGLADALASTSIMTQNVTLSGTAQFDDYSNSDPLTRFRTARSAVKNGCGLPPDTAIMSWEVAQVLKYHPLLLDFLGFKEARPGGLSFEELAKALEVKRVLVGSASYESAKEGQASSLQPIWGKNIIFGVCPEKPQLRQIALGYEVVYIGGTPRKVYKYPINNPPEATGILVEDEYDQLLHNVLAGYLLKDAIS